MSVIGKYLLAFYFVKRFNKIHRTISIRLLYYVRTLSRGFDRLAANGYKNVLGD